MTAEVLAPAGEVRRVDAARVARAFASAVARTFWAVGWLVCWLAPPFVVVLVRVVWFGLRWCASAALVGWVEARDGRPVVEVARR